MRTWDAARTGDVHQDPTSLLALCLLPSPSRRDQSDYRHSDPQENWKMQRVLQRNGLQQCHFFYLLSFLTSHFFSSLSLLKSLMFAGKPWSPGRKASDLGGISHKPLVLKFGICSSWDQLKCGSSDELSAPWPSSVIPDRDIGVKSTPMHSSLHAFLLLAMIQ